MPTILFLIHCLVALNLFGAALAGAVHTTLVRKVRNLSFVYFGWSLAGQVLALPLLLATVGSLYLAQFGARPSPVIAIANLATIILFVIILFRAWRGSLKLSKVVRNRRGGVFGRFVLGALFPFRLRGRSVTRLKNIAYGPKGRRNLVDIYAPKKTPSSLMPVLMTVHGGGWVIGRKGQQSQPLIQYMASQGWLVVDINYRLGPWTRMPAMIQDVLRAVAWIKANIERYNGNPDFVALSGGSAGGHLVALAALASDAQSFKPGFERVDCSIDACVPVYGLYDLLNDNGAMRGGFEELQKFMTMLVMPGSPNTHKDAWQQASPINYIGQDAPPMMFLHGRHDALADFESAKSFAQSLERVSNNAVLFVDLPGGQHGYDFAHAPPTPEHVRAVHRFLEEVRSGKILAK